MQTSEHHGQRISHAIVMTDALNIPTKMLYDPAPLNDMGGTPTNSP